MGAPERVERFWCLGCLRVVMALHPLLPVPVQVRVPPLDVRCEVPLAALHLRVAHRRRREGPELDAVLRGSRLDEVGAKRATTGANAQATLAERALELGGAASRKQMCHEHPATRRRSP